MATYEEAGVSIDAQDRAIEKIKTCVSQTRTRRVISELGSFGGLFDISFPDLEQPVLVSSADGVGTKLKIAFTIGKHDTVGQCLVNHCVNDILVQGARPLFFMDYIATGKLKPDVVASVVEGMSIACKENRMAILGGEMAEMPGFYQSGEYDVAGFIVGVVDRKKILSTELVKKDQVLIGLSSTGLHTNGYSLARKIIFDDLKMNVTDAIPGSDFTVAESLLQIHRSYYPMLWPLLEQDLIKGMSHITGGGFLDNIPRVIPKHCDVEIVLGSFPSLPIFNFLVEKGHVARDEAYRVFNMGIGMVLIVDKDGQQQVLDFLNKDSEQAFVIGQVVDGAGEVRLV
ncbi:MAG: phosphoribosylformylglycinamidine cyclo-ligase [Acidobacteria bacterium]|nr:MAG: phosphoribosylformylglycinamidine cyclo-ligase [Acidobacteriota bacterium]